MKPNIRLIIAVLIIIAAVLPVSAGAEHVRVRTIFGMEPIGVLSVTGFGTGGRESWSTGYGFTPGLEVYYILTERIEIGAGIKWQLDRRIFRDLGQTDESFAFIPFYVTTRFDITEVENFSTYALLKLGYAIFRSSQEFRDIWSGEPGGSLTSTSGGIYAAGALGVNLNLTERPKWGLDLSMDVGYAFQGATGTNPNKTYQISYQAMSTDFALDWRF